MNATDQTNGTHALSELPPGVEAEVVGIAEDAPDRTRLLDLGFVPGTVVSRLMESPLGDPIAYQVRGTVIALRSEQTARIEVRRCS